MSILFSVLLIQALHVLLILADSFNITVIEADTNGGTVSYRVWYGDGQAYVGTGIPDTVEQAIDITTTETDTNIPAGLTKSAAGGGTGPSYFMAINTDPAASDPVWFTDSPASLPDTAAHRWVAYGGYLLPVDGAGHLVSAPLGGGAYLVPVSSSSSSAAAAAGTYSLRWIMDAGVAEGLGGTKVLLSSLPVLAVASS
ncbi:hypothetical protein VSDG_03435 [Cytospora chrysosperma]|uniref:Uncharacterized protein n=1 Tax=Cytospora chrysosperma TaxID=252740 RepID=A0A423WA57_CYTCH|nr:hypothetical protein VSDG_03435 [Valsa sordida]